MHYNVCDKHTQKEDLAFSKAVGDTFCDPKLEKYRKRKERLIQSIENTYTRKFERLIDKHYTKNMKNSA